MNLCRCIAFTAASVLLAADPGNQLVSIGDRHLYTRCTGESGKATVLLLNGLGAGLEEWTAVQSAVEKFAKVCSYDRAGEGHSDKIAGFQTPDAVVDDLHQLLDAVAAPGPYVLVGASLGGIFARRFAQRYPDLTAGMVLADSSHEEQYSHFAVISPALGERFATQDGRFNRDKFLEATGQLPPGRHLDWHLDVPLIVLEHKRLVGPPRTEDDRVAVVWHELQVDLSGRSRYGRLVESPGGHAMADEQPEIVVKSIQEVIQQLK